MRLICDHCGGPISGRVQRMPESLNFHPDCLAEVVNGGEQESAAVSWQSQEAPVTGWNRREDVSALRSGT